MASRIDSASSRRRGNRQSQRSLGVDRGVVRRRRRSRAGRSRESRICAVHRLDRPARRRRTARRASRAARDASAVRRGRPKFDGVATIPRPKWCCQIRLTMTRAVSGWSGRVSQSRQLEPSAASATAMGGGGSPARNANRGTPRGTTGPGLAGLAPPLERRRRPASPRRRRRPPGKSGGSAVRFRRSVPAFSSASRRRSLAVFRSSEA